MRRPDTRLLARSIHDEPHEIVTYRSVAMGTTNETARGAQRARAARLRELLTRLATGGDLRERGTTHQVTALVRIGDSCTPKGVS